MIECCMIVQKNSLKKGFRVQLKLKKSNDSREDLCFKKV